MAVLKQYDPGKVSFIAAGFTITGFSKDSFIKAERRENSFNMAVGAEGHVARSKNNDKTGTITISLMQTAESNLVLTGLMTSDELSGNSTFPVLVRDSSGYTILNAANAWIEKAPAITFSNEVQNVDWVFGCAELNMIVGGN